VPAPTHLSRARYAAGHQCPKRLWWEVHEPGAPELRPRPAEQAAQVRRRRIGELARERFPGGVLVGLEPWRLEERSHATAAALAAGAPAIFEASLDAGGVFATVDVLERGAGGWTLAAVSSALEVKPRHLPDVAVQTFAARAAGLDVRRAELMHLNRACTFPHLEDLFVRADVTAEVEALQPEVPGRVAALRAALEGPLPDVAIGPHCHAPFDCPFLARCHPPVPDDDVSRLYCVGEEAVAAWREAGIRRLADIPLDAELLPAQARQIRAARTGAVVVELGLAAALDALVPPVAFLDFETVAPPVPAWDGCHPYEPVPVQLSCHVVLAGGRTEHHAHLAEGSGDPRPAVAAAVVRACEGARAVVAYNATFEALRLDHLAVAVPELAEPLRSIRGRLVDLLAVVRDHVYHPAFGARFGLKSVLPALVPGLGYGDLAIADGGAAAAALEELLLGTDPLDPATRARIREELLRYCARDTEALLRLSERLRTLARPA
jgi:hypothetical protein